MFRMASKKKVMVSVRKIHQVYNLVASIFEKLCILSCDTIPLGL